MATRQSFVEFVCDQAGLGRLLTTRRMFGEYALYYDGKVVALACDDRLFLKDTAAGRGLLEQVTEGAPFPGAKPWLVIDAALDEPDLLARLLRSTALALPAPAPRKPRRKSAAAKPRPRRR